MHRSCSVVMLVLAVSVLAGAASVWAEAPTGEIILQAISPRDIVLMELPEGTQTSSGLSAVGVGTPVYLRFGGTDPDEGEITGGEFTLSGKPSGSGAALVAGPSDMMTLLPDVTGQYTVELVVTDDQGEASAPVSQVITAGTWVGVGTVGGATPDVGKGQCGLCHADQTALWQETDHASMLQRGLDGIASSHYGPNCISCHSVGYNAAETAVNDGFDDRAAALGWAFPDTLVPGTWAALPAELKEVSDIQCETCHGPGSEHKGAPGTIATSMGSGVCAVCHDSGSHHIFPYEWSFSKHSVTTTSGTGEGRENCAKCHSGRGFAEYVSKGAVENPEYAPIGCATCHDPHSAENAHHLRKIDDVELGNGEVVTEGGLGKLCMNCHKSRRNVDEYVKEYHGHYGPHHGPQADMLAGTGAVEYGGKMASSGHIYAAEDACVTCHMAPGIHEEVPGQFKVGEHSFAMGWDGDTPDDPSDDVLNVDVCIECHGPMESFDIPRADYDGDGTVEGVQTEVKDLMEVLAMALPPVGEAEVEVTEEYTPEQLMAAYNYEFVLEDKSYGIHNTKYTVGMLKGAIKDLTGQRIVTAAEEETAVISPLAYALSQNYPNPFNPTTHIEYSLPKDGTVHLMVTDALGQTVRELVNGFETAGRHTVVWDGRDVAGSDVATGIYFYRLESNGFLSTRKMVLVR